ncbi:unnamed protein product [Calypogeia fissa]
MRTKSCMFLLYCSWQGGSRSLSWRKGLQLRRRDWARREYCQRVSGAQVFNSIKGKEQQRSYHFVPSMLKGVHQTTIIPRIPTIPRSIVRKAAVGTMADSAGLHSHDSNQISYLSQADAIAVDEILMGPLGFSVDQLMELAGLSVASAIAEVYKVQEYSRILIVAGPGNNGGDGLVAARHLHHFGYNVAVCYPKRTEKPLYHGLVTQLESLKVPFVSHTELPRRLSDKFDIVVDAMFGFSFKGTPRPPFGTFLQRLIVSSGSKAADLGVPPVVSIDIPSGWNVEEGDVEGTGLAPDMLVSLTAPKLCAKNFKGPHHFLGGRFVPPAVVEKFGLRIPPYPGNSQCVRIGKTSSVDVSALRKDYVGLEFSEDQAKSDPIEQFQEWFEAVAANLPEPNAMTLATVDAQSRPSARIVLLKGYGKQGFVWYTNYGSRKASDLTENPHAALVFFWEAVNRSVRVEGIVEKVSEEESTQYFHSRPRGSQIGAMVSKQSTIIQDRGILDQAYEDLLRQFPEGVVIPKPDYWGGYRLRPLKIEFWQGRSSRLHDRLIYTLVNQNGTSPSWVIERQAP